MDSFLSLAAVPLGIVLAVVAYRASRPSGAKTKDCGPPRRFFVGNALDMPAKYEWVAFDKWKEIYGGLNPPFLIAYRGLTSHLAGPIFSLNVIGQSIVVLGTAESASLLLDKHSAINSDRPDLQMAGKL